MRLYAQKNRAAHNPKSGDRLSQRSSTAKKRGKTNSAGQSRWPDEVSSTAAARSSPKSTCSPPRTASNRKRSPPESYSNFSTKYWIKFPLKWFNYVFSFSPKDLTVTIGEHDRKTESSRKSVHHVAKIYRHPNFRLSTFDNDIAIIELREVAPLESSWVRVACLPKSGK